MLTELRGLERANVWDYENGFYWFAPFNRIAKQIAHWELYKRIVGLPGHAVELGVYKGASLVRWCTFREMVENTLRRKVIAFDAFGAFPTPPAPSQSDRDFIERFEVSGGDGLSKDDVDSMLSSHGFKNYELVQGDVFETVPEYLASHGQLRIALLHLDMDVHAPTAFALEQLWDRVVPGGIVVVDDYNAVAGATQAVDDFVATLPGISVEGNPYYNQPSFLVKR